MSAALRAAEATPWLEGKRIRSYNPTLASLALLVAVVVALPFALAVPRFAPLALALFVLGFAGALVLRWHAIKGLRLNNDGVALMARGEDAAAATSFRLAAVTRHGRDVVAMSLYNLGVLALRSLDVTSARALQRAALAVTGGFRYPWQPAFAADFARGQLAFAIAATANGDAELDEADALLASGKPPVSPLAIAFAARARALVAARRGRFEETVSILEGERALLRNVLPLNDAVLAEALLSLALLRLSRPHDPVLADPEARSYATRIFPECEPVLVA